MERCICGILRININIEFKEVITSDELLKVAKEGAMLQYKNGKYELYSENGYDMLEEE